MDINLLEITTEELLEKFGAGNHKPGSGSAAAFQGMLSAKLLVTVISLTNGRDKYKKVIPKLLEMSENIHNRIFPELTELFHQDAVQFGKTISAREERNNEKDLFKSNQLARKALNELKISIEIPITISKLCIELTEISGFVFDNAFQSARGDSQVALSGAVAGLAGCLSIIQLNLLSFESDEYSWTSKIIEEAEKLKNKYRELNEVASSKIEILENEVQSKSKFHKEVNKLLNEVKAKPKLTNSDIEKAATDLQNLMWIHKKTIWKDNIPDHPTKVLKPNIVFKKALGYNFSITDSIGVSESDSTYSEIAGLINQDEKIVLVSNNFEKNTQNFTAAHELGHAILHKQTVMHRDRPIDGSSRSGGRSLEEIQADKFATNFLMPTKMVKEIFAELFLTDKFVINEDNAFNLIKDSPSKLRAECKNLRGLSLKLAAAERFNNESFNSIAKLFDVSITAMAIRLEELNLIDF